MALEEPPDGSGAPGAPERSTEQDHVPDLGAHGPPPPNVGPLPVGVPGLEDVHPVQLRAVQESLLDPSLVLRAQRRPDGVIVDFVCEDANEAACESLEVPRDDLVGALLTITLPGELGAFLLDQCIHTVETGEPLAFDDLRTPGDGSGDGSHYDLRAVAVADRVCFTWRNVTERHRDQQALAESRNRYRLLAEFSSDVVVLVSPGGIVEWVSPSVHEMLGWQPEEIIGRPSADFVVPEDHDRRVAVHRHPAAMNPPTDEVRCRRAGGDHLWVSARMREVHDDEGRLVNVVVSMRDVDKQVRARQALLESEERYRLLAEHVSDVVYQVLDGRIVWISPSVERVLGWKPADVIGRPSFDLIAPEDRDRAAAARASVVAGSLLEGFECRFRTADGGYRWMLAHSRQIASEQGTYGLVAGLQDIHDGHAGHMALAALAAVNSVLVGATDEAELVDEVCRLVVTEGGFAGAAFRATGDDAVLSPGGETVTEFPVAVDGRIDGTLVLRSAEADAVGGTARSALEQLAHQTGMALSRIRTRERLVESLSEQQLLSTAIEQAGESVIVTDLEGRTVYANPATATSSGYSLEEIVGSDHTLFASGLHGPEFFEDLYATLGVGEPWRGVIVNRTKDGRLFEEDTTITPVRGDDGAVTSYVSVMRNISRELRLAADLDRLRSDRDSVVRTMAEVRVGATIEATAASLCDAVSRMEDIDVARVLLVEPNGTVVPLGITGPVYLGWRVGVPLSFDHLSDLLDMTRMGAWWLPLEPAVDGAGGLIEPELTAELWSAGFRSAGFAPIWWEDRMVGVLAVTSSSPEDDQWLDARVPVLDELGSFAGQVLGAQAARRAERRLHVDDIRYLVADEAFHPVFQPVVDLATGDVLGHEALTRFASGRRPDLVFEEAHEAGLGVELETACALAAARSAASLPPGGWLAVNFSPASVIAGSVSKVVTEADRPLVVEITEHVEVSSYAAVRAAVHLCPGVRISVDDAGAGYASLRHILELQPDFVKLDIGLVRNIDSDPARQALAAGLRHYAEQTDTILIAEGVETVAERDALARLQIPLAQGFLYGRPSPVGEAAEHPGQGAVPGEPAG